MKKRIAAALLCALIVFTSCSLSLVTLTYKDGAMRNDRMKLVYRPADLCFEPVSVGEAYAYYKKGDVTFYEIPGTDPTEWLTEEYTGTTTTVFYKEGITLPTLSEMKPEKAYICANEAITMAVATVEDETVIEALIDAFENGEYEEWPLVGAEVTYEIKFHSEAWSWLYYNLTYGRFPEGEFLYDRQSKRSVRIDGLLSQYIR